MCNMAFELDFWQYCGKTYEACLGIFMGNMDKYTGAHAKGFLTFVSR